MTAVQGSFDDLGAAVLSPSLSETTFVVVDLETTGGSAHTEGITEIGAVKVRGGEVIGEFHTLVNPLRPIPTFIAVLTGITDATVADAPVFDAVLPAFLEFSAGAVLVAHNAPFDIGFLKAAAARQGVVWPSFAVVDTVKLARALVPRGETRNLRLATLAVHFGSPTAPTHRALDDARATVHVLHALIGRTGTLGISTLDDLLGFSRTVPHSVRRKAGLADGLPDEPGVYQFVDDAGRVLYVGTSRSLRSRVRSYFTASEQRSRIRQMVGLAERVVPIVCPTSLEARVRELRLIAEHRPPYNRRSRNPERTLWLRLTDEAFPRLSIVRAPRGEDAAIGPFARRQDAEAARAALHQAFPLRQCTSRITLRQDTSACVLAEMGRCGAPCDGRQTREAYAHVVNQVRHAMVEAPATVLASLEERITALSDQQRYEEAAIVRDRLRALLRASTRAARLRSLARLPLLAAAAPSHTRQGHWDIAVVRFGRLAGTSCVPHGPRLRPALEATIAASATIAPDGSGLPLGHIDEAFALLDWLERPGVRPALIEGDWALPLATSGARWSHYTREDVAAIQRFNTSATAPESIAAAARSRATRIA